MISPVVNFTVPVISLNEYFLLFKKNQFKLLQRNTHEHMHTHRTECDFDDCVSSFLCGEEYDVGNFLVTLGSTWGYFHVC